MRWRSACAVVLLAIAILVRNVFLSTVSVFERKNIIHGKVEIASLLKSQYVNHPSRPLRLYFPFAEPYNIMEFAVYLDYRGIPLRNLMLVSPLIDADAPCVDFSSIECRFASVPAAGDLVMVLPEDEASAGAARAYRKKGALLLLYEPRLPIPEWWYPLAGGFPLVAGGFSALPSRWMDASVTAWK
jgi:hypothetical protein